MASQIHCTQCGERNEDKSRFCFACGSQLTSRPGAAAAERTATVAAAPLALTLVLALLGAGALHAAAVIPVGENIGGNLLAGCKVGKFEPSGLAWHAKLEQLLVVDDGGRLAQVTLDGTVVACPDIGGDLEGIALVDDTSSIVYVAIENPPAIVEYDLSSGERRTWALTELERYIENRNQGIEALTFVPDAEHPNGGRFYVGLQGDGRIYVIDLPIATAGGKVTITDILVPSPTQPGMSGLVWDAAQDRLLALYDRGDLLIAMGLDGKLLTSWKLPGGDHEGVALVGCDLYTADDSGMLWRFAGFPGAAGAGDGDGDGVNDCVDRCATTPDASAVDPFGCACGEAQAAVCGNGLCEMADGEDCLSCSADCRGIQTGDAAARFCCGIGGAGDNPVTCKDPRCGDPGEECTLLAASCCGDAVCGINENPCRCPADCPPPDTAEAHGQTCADALDNDCDGLADCLDRDCLGRALAEGDCNDGRDDDCDGRRDCGDSDCCFDEACPAEPDADGDSFALCDCDDADPSTWGPAGGVRLAFLAEAELSWTPPVPPGGVSAAYDVLRSASAFDFVNDTTCVESGETLDTQAVDPAEPPVGGLYFYLVRSDNTCPGLGELGLDESLRPRVARLCP